MPGCSWGQDPNGWEASRQRCLMVRGSSSCIPSVIIWVLTRAGIGAGDEDRARWHYQHPIHGLCYVPASSSIIQHAMIYSPFLPLCCFCTSVVVGMRGCQPGSVGHRGGQAHARPCLEPGVVNGEVGVGWKSPSTDQGPGRPQHCNGHCRCRVCDVGDDGGSSPGLAEQGWPAKCTLTLLGTPWLCVKGPTSLPVLPKGQKPLCL